MPDAPPPEDTALGTQSAALEVGLRVFRQYLLKRFLSRGPLGSAWLVVHESLGRELAMRFLPEAWRHDDRVMSRLREAVVKMLEITHPGLVGVLDFARDAQAAAVVSKYLEGEMVLEARAQMPQRCFEVDRVAPWVVQVCVALDFAWRQHQAVHGDLCPANLLLTPLGDLKVCDFGLARCLFDLEGPAGGPLLAIAPSHLSPARLRGEPATVADDVYGFGATLYDLLTSKPPFFRGESNETPPPRMAARRAELGIGGGLIPEVWEEVIAACLAPQPGDRPGTVREIGERLGVLAPLPADAARAPQPVVFPRPHETVVDYEPPSTRPPRPAAAFPSSMPTQAMESPTQSAPPPPEEPSVVEHAPATVDENLEATHGEPEAEPDLEVTMAAEKAASATPPPAAPFVPPPPPEPQPTGDDAEATLVAEPPPPPVALAPPVAPPADIPADLEESRTIPTAEREARKSASLLPRPVAPPTEPRRQPAPAPPSPLMRWWWVSIPVVLLVAFVLGFHSRKGSTPANPEPTPLAVAETPVPAPTPVPPTPLPATPEPTPVTPPPTPAIRTVPPNELAALADQGAVRSPLLLTGDFHVTTSNAGAPATAILRPANAAWKGQVRVSVTLAPGAKVPREDSDVTLTAASRYFIQEVRRGADGQINVTVQQAP